MTGERTADKYKDNFVRYKNVASILVFEKKDLPVTALRQCDKGRGTRTGITFAVPTYKRRDRVIRVLNDIAIQTDQCFAFEVVVVDNDSESDGDTEAFVRTLRKLPIKRIRYYQNSENIGMFANWNRCIELAAYEWVAMIHDDDGINDNYLEYASCYLDFLKRDERCAYVKVNVAGKSNACDLIEYRLLDISLLTPSSIGILGAPTAGTLLNRNAIMDIGGYDEENWPCDDAYLVSRLILSGYKVFETCAGIGKYNWEDNASYKTETLIGDAEITVKLFKDYVYWSGVSKIMSCIFKNEIYYACYEGIEKLVIQSDGVKEKEHLLRKVNSIMPVRKRKIMYIIFKAVRFFHRRCLMMHRIKLNKQ